jgi:hypothetical protein
MNLVEKIKILMIPMMIRAVLQTLQWKRKSFYCKCWINKQEEKSKHLILKRMKLAVI